MKISAIEQLKFLNDMVRNSLPVSDEAIINTKKNMFLGKLDNGAMYYGKTGSGKHGRTGQDASRSPLRDAWFVGFVDHGFQRYIFVSNLTDKTPPDPQDKSYGGMVLNPIVLRLLNDYFGE